MEAVQELLGKVNNLPKEDFDAFDESYILYRNKKRREGFIKSYEEAMASKAKGELFKTDNVEHLFNWLNG